MFSAITTQTAENIPSQTFTVDPYQHRLITMNLTFNKSHVLIRINFTPICNDYELTILSWQFRLGYPVYQFLMATTISNKLRYTYHLKTKFVRYNFQLR